MKEKIRRQEPSRGPRDQDKEFEFYSKYDGAGGWGYSSDGRVLA